MWFCLTDTSKELIFSGRCEDRRVEDDPALIHHAQAGAAGHARGAMCRGMGYQQAHSSFEPWVILQFRDIEVEPGAVESNGRWPIEELRIGSFVHPDPKLGTGQTRHSVNL